MLPAKLRQAFYLTQTAFPNDLIQELVDLEEEEEEEKKEKESRFKDIIMELKEAIN